MGHAEGRRGSRERRGGLSAFGGGNSTSGTAEAVAGHEVVLEKPVRRPAYGGRFGELKEELAPAP